MHCYLKQRKENGVWYIWQYDERDGSVSKHSCRTRDRAEAEKQLAKHILSRPDQQQLGDALVLSVMNRYWELHGKNCFGAGTVRLVIGRLLDLMPDVTVSQFNATRQQQFIQGVAAGTGKRYLGQVFAALNWAHGREEIAAPPRKIKVVCQDGEGAQPLSLSQLRALCEAANTKRRRLFMALAIATAQRPAHILELTWDRVHFDTGVIDFQDPKRKRTKKVRPVVPMCPALQSLLIEHRSIGPVIQRHGRRLRSHRMLFERLAKDAKVAGSAYGIRKAAATYLRRSGVPEMDLKGMLGHRLGGVTDRYAHLDPQFMTAAKAACQSLLVEMDAGWLRRFTSQSLTSDSVQSIASAGNHGAGKGARTLDLNLGKGWTFEDYQDVKASNDD